MDKRTKTRSQYNADLANLHKRLRGGHVLRYHTRPELIDGQNVAAHTWRTMVILQTLWPDISKNGLLYMMYHDVAEAETGDMPATTKWKYPELNKMMGIVEREYEERIGLENFEAILTKEEQDKCDVADKLELVFHCYRLMQQGNTLADDVFSKGTDYLMQRYGKEAFFSPVKEILNALSSEYRKPSRLQVTLEQFSNL